jgi:hypothetical protein
MMTTTPRSRQIGGRPARQFASRINLPFLFPGTRAFATILVFLAMSGSATAQMDPWEGMGGDPLLPRASGHARPVPEQGGGRFGMTAPWLTPEVSPRAARDIPPQVYQVFVRSYAFAAEQVRSRPACKDLFSALGADGSDILEKTYYLRSKTEDHALCVSGVAAYTHVRDQRCWLCPRFAGLSVSAGAMILLHEALHRAGLPEDPRNETALNSFGINHMVHQACFRN